MNAAVKSQKCLVVLALQRVVLLPWVRLRITHGDGWKSLVVIPVVSFLTPPAEYSSDLKDRWTMLSQLVFVVNMSIKQAVHLLVHMAFLYLFGKPWDTCVII